MKNRTIACALSIALLGSMGAAVLTPTSVVMAADASGTTASLSDILKNQQSDGGWKKDYSETSGDWAKSTIDNKATYSEIRRLAAEYSKTKDSKYSAAAIKGINFLFNMQYSNGGFPQIYKSSGYHTHITYNDDAMVNVLILLDEVANRKGDFSFIDSSVASKAKQAVDKGVDCILKTQVTSGGKLTAWGQQHDSSSLKPAGARAFEVPSLSASESVGIVKFLKTRPSNSQINASIKAAEDWFKAVKISGFRYERNSSDSYIIADSSSTIWARFYELNTNKPIFVGRDGVVKYNLKDIEQERRAGYAWYGNWPTKIGIN
ncbi:pectate lyase [Paenibacillus hunanensis]|uniref:PelA/Pel-15E family pectate lyase n=1 Tax=Paenibacillus hunanensis TaxID=539262 RepID=A0ABU1ISE7_9BACL|nr:pectate lyase [Paenibacillus hunanensis]MDR6242174.1 PelA/Pel-15E family pectate lyase [Paenibacillus hunanensis]GGJ05845.1 pectate lyase [Paenibacillus hunanensis]